MTSEIKAMDCWHFIAPLIPVTDDPMTVDIYVSTFHAFKLMKEEQEEKERKRKQCQ